MATPRAPIPYSRVLFTDHCFPACSPDFLKRFPQAVTPEGLAAVPLVGIDWGGGYASEPQWCEWFESQGVRPAPPVRLVAVYSLSGLALDAAVDGQGAVLAQAAFADDHIRRGRLVRLSPHSLTMPDPARVHVQHQVRPRQQMRGDEARQPAGRAGIGAARKGAVHVAAVQRRDPAFRQHRGHVQRRITISVPGRSAGSSLSLIHI